jgi:hypothetical protein
VVIRLIVALLMLGLLALPTVQQAISLGINGRFSYELFF